MSCPYLASYQQLANQYVDQLYREQTYSTQTRDRQDVNYIYRIIITRYSNVLEPLQRYNIPPAFVEVLTRQIIQFTIARANSVTGNLPRRVEIIYREFAQTNQRIFFILRLFGVPENVIEAYVKGVIRATLIIIGITDGTEEEVERLTNLFERRFPNFLGLTNIYNIPRRAARRITADIIEFTLDNIEHIPAFGTIPQRANAMLLLLDRESPQLIEAMINRGVPAVRAEQITLRIITFTLRNGEE